jgi:sugar fermentation stimulation protein A
MRFPTPLVAGRLERRYKRFLADVALDDGRHLTVHCPNTGAMLGCDRPGSRVWLSRSDNPRRRYPFTWEIVETRPGVLVGIHTGRSNQLVEEGLRGGVIAELDGFTDLRREVRLPGERTRVDFVLRYEAGAPPCYLEVKNVTAAVEDGVALFPDAVSVRAVKHLEVLGALVRDGCRAALCYCVQRSDVRAVVPAASIDPAYADELRRARDAGVEVLAYGCRVDPDGLTVTERLDVPEDVI